MRVGLLFRVLVNVLNGLRLALLWLKLKELECHTATKHKNKHVCCLFIVVKFCVLWVVGWLFWLFGRSVGLPPVVPSSFLLPLFPPGFGLVC